jgi:hypothetical protein
MLKELDVTPFIQGFLEVLLTLLLSKNITE